MKKQSFLKGPAWAKNLEGRQEWPWLSQPWFLARSWPCECEVFWPGGPAFCRPHFLVMAALEVESPELYSVSWGLALPRGVHLQPACCLAKSNANFTTRADVVSRLRYSKKRVKPQGHVVRCWSFAGEHMSEVWLKRLDCFSH